MTNAEREKLLAWLDEQIKEFDPKVKPPYSNPDDITIIKTAIYQGMWIAYRHVKERLESEPTRDEA